MRTLVTLLLVIASASAQFFPGFPFGGFPFGGFPFLGLPFQRFPFPNNFPSEDVYAASLQNAPVGLYGKTHPGGPFGGGPGGFSSDITSASLGGAKVGLYGKEHPGQGFPAASPPIFVNPIRPGIRPPVTPQRPPTRTY